MAEGLNRLGYGTESRGFGSRLWATEDWKTFYVHPAINVDLDLNSILSMQSIYM